MIDLHTVEEWYHKSFTEPVKIAIDENKNGKIITGMGAGREGSGTTTNLYQFALRLAQINPEYKIIMVDLNLAEPCLDSYFLSGPSKIMHLDNLYKLINTEILKTMLENNIVINKELDNLYLLPGTRRPFSADSYNAEVLMAILASLRHLFDVVIVDISSHFDNPGTVSGLLTADHILVFSNYDLNGMRIFNLYYETLFKHYDVMQKMHLIGVDNKGVITEDLKHLTEVKLLVELPYVKELYQGTQLKGKQADKYYLQLDQMIEELNLSESVEIHKERRGRLLWPFRRSSSSNV